MAALYERDAVKVLAGCAPCQTFSKHTQKVKNRENDKKWNLLYQFSGKIQDIKPDIVSMENIPGLAKYQVFEDFLATLTALQTMGIGGAQAAALLPEPQPGAGGRAFKNIRW